MRRSVYQRMIYLIQGRSETDLVELLEESTITDIAVILGNRDGIQFTHSKGD